MEKSVGLFKST